MPKQEIQTYPPEGWVCPSCGKEHKAPHWAHEGQIDYDVKPDNKGRVLFNRRHKDDTLDRGMKVIDGLPQTGSQFDDKGLMNALYCPHCGFEATQIIVLRKGDAPDLITQFEQEEGLEMPKTWRKIIQRFIDWKGRRQNGQ